MIGPNMSFYLSLNDLHVIHLIGIVCIFEVYSIWEYFDSAIESFLDMNAIAFSDLSS